MLVEKTPIATARERIDRALLAEASLAREPLAEPYAAVIVDEAQDLSCAMVRMLYSLVGDAPDGFTLIGDGLQSIYPGGYTLAEAGISVIAVEAGASLLLDRGGIEREAAARGVSVVGIRHG